MENTIAASNLCVRDGPGECPGEGGWRAGAQPCYVQGPTSSILIMLLLPLFTAQHGPAEVMANEGKGKNGRAPNLPFDTFFGKVGG